jgi:hypothetical protein
VLLLLTHRLVLRAVAVRGRPVLPDDLRVADDAIRAFASRRVSLEALATAVLLAGWQVGVRQPPIPGLLWMALIVGAVLVTVVLIFRSRPRPPRRLARSLATVA